MDAHPAVSRCVVALDRWLPLIPFVCYPVLLCLLNVRLFHLLGSQAALDFMVTIARAVFVPGFAFWGGTILRDKLNLPRPYEQPSFEPLRRKETKGHSFPSRHALSASVLAMVWMYFYPKAGWAMVGITVPLTMYVARHSWASAARELNIPISVISEGMGHDNEATTRIYLASIDTRVVDHANQLILDAFR